MCAIKRNVNKISVKRKLKQSCNMHVQQQQATTHGTLRKQEKNKYQIKCNGLFVSLGRSNLHFQCAPYELHFSDESSIKRCFSRPATNSFTTFCYSHAFDFGKNKNLIRKPMPVARRRKEERQNKRRCTLFRL